MPRIYEKELLFKRNKNVDANYSVICQMIEVTNVIFTIETYVDRSPEKTISVRTRDIIVDKLYDTSFREFLKPT